MSEPKITSIEQLIKEYQDVLYLEDTSSVIVMNAAVIANYLPGIPIYLALIGASSGGKSEILSFLLKMDKIISVSDLTANTFLSGKIASRGEETSLLLRMGKQGIFIFKDFTTLLSGNPEKQNEIMAQLREIYDGSLVKYTGNGQKLEWKGRAGLLVASTDIIYTVTERYQAMGSRLIYFQIPEQDRKKTMDRAFENEGTMDAKREHLQIITKQYIEDILAKVKSGVTYEIPADIIQNVKDVADFASMARSAVSRDFKKVMEFAHQPEMPMRMATQIFKMGKAMLYMYDGKLSKEAEQSLYHMAFSSVPILRMRALHILAENKNATTAGIATALQLPQAVARMHLEDLTVMKMVKRHASTSTTHMWSISEEHRSLLTKYQSQYIGPYMDETLDSEEYEEDTGTFRPYQDTYGEKDEVVERRWRDEGKKEEDDGLETI